MCGIAGILKIHQPGEPVPEPLRAIPEAWLDILDDSIKHRGPDGQGRFRDRSTRPDGSVVDVALVHRRLSIIDHAGGHQPMVHDGDRLRPDLTYQPGDEPFVASDRAPGLPLVAVVFNGCIYNHRELRAELTAMGHRFETDHSDTEVLVHGWRGWGLRGIDEVDGMYAFLTWDRATSQLADGRDQAGEKPLYRNETGAAFVFASTPVGPLLCQRGMIQGSESLVAAKGIEEWIESGEDRIPPLPLIELSKARWVVRPGTPRHGGDIPEERRPRSSTQPMLPRRNLVLPQRGDPGFKFGGPLGGLRHASEHIESCIESRLDADVPIGVFLSGGIDSSLVAAIAHRRRPDIIACTVRMPDHRHDESMQAAETARHIGIEHSVIDCEPAPSEDLLKLIPELGLPFGDSSLLPTYWVSKAASQRVRVALSGDGADELFGGYRRHTINSVIDRWRLLLRLTPDRILDRRTPGRRSSYLARLAVSARFSGYDELTKIFPTPDLRRVIRDDWRSPAHRITFHRELDPLRRDFDEYLPNDLLRKTDTASMSVPIEVRAPFLARDLVNAAMRTPLNSLMPGNQRKGLLKQVARKYLPDHIVDRPKQGFAIPIGEWFRSDYGGMRQLLYDHLESADPFPGLADAGVELNMGFVRQMLREHDQAGEKSINPWHGRDHSQRLYMLLVLSIWAKWLDGIRKSPLPTASA
ncbi:MAG: asparagine synthase-related protein [Planctomycetota bacterium]